MLATSADNNAVGGPEGRTGVHFRKGKMSRVWQLLENDTDANIRDKEGYTS